MIINYSRKGVCLAMAMALSTCLFTACQTAPSKQDIGTAAGGVLGAAVGSQIGEGSGRTAAVIGGALLGGLIGRSIGRYMDERDYRMAGQALETTPTDQSTTWRNPDTGYRYSLTPTRTYESQTGRPCREFVTEAYIEGERQVVRGTACRQPDGTWEVIG